MEIVEGDKQLEVNSTGGWIAPNPHTIEFSDRKRQEVFKPFQFMDDAKLVSVLYHHLYLSPQ